MLINIIDYQILAAYIQSKWLNIKNDDDNDIFPETISDFNKFYDPECITAELDRIKTIRKIELKENKDLTISDTNVKFKLIDEYHQIFYIVPTVSHALVIEGKPSDNEKQNYKNLALKTYFFSNIK